MGRPRRQSRSGSPPPRAATASPSLLCCTTGPSGARIVTSLTPACMPASVRAKSASACLIELQPVNAVRVAGLNASVVSRTKTSWIPSAGSSTVRLDTGWPFSLSVKALAARPVRCSPAGSFTSAKARISGKALGSTAVTTADAADWARARGAGSPVTPTIRARSRRKSGKGNPYSKRPPKGEW